MTITLTREEAQQVLDALEDIRYADISERQNKALETLRARLAQPKPEPVMLMDAPLLLNGQPLYTAPPQREWQGLTDDEKTYLAWESKNGPHCVDMTEAMLKEKNR